MGPLGWILLLSAWFVWPFFYNQIYTKRYMLAGTEVENQEAAFELGIGNAAESFVISALRKCPFCAEMVKKEAKVCRFCQRDLPQS
jgi:hypothetical protein